MGKKLIPGKNDLQSQRPDLAAEWHPNLNGSLSAADVTVFSSKKVWWQIKTNRFGKEFVLDWQASVSNRANGSGCPYTSTPPKKLLEGFNDLQSTNPELAREWHPTKNAQIKPNMVFENTDKPFWWYHKVKKDGREFEHEWYTSPKTAKRNKHSSGCPFCHGTEVLTGFNDLSTCFPELIKEWDYDKNSSLETDPQKITPGSNKKVYWICRICGHSWKASIINRTYHNSGCPQCAHRSQTSFSEQAIYFYLRKHYGSCINRDKTVLGGGELDIFLPDISYAIEYCGIFSHATKEIADKQKQRLCEEKGIVLTLVCENEKNNEYLPDKHIIYCIPQNDYSHLNYVMNCLNEEMKTLNVSHLDIHIDLENDEHFIREQYQQSQIKNSIAVTHPYLLVEWDYDKNGLLNPQAFSHGSNILVYWKHTVKKDDREFIHSWKARISTRTSGRGCPICSSKKIQKGYNDLLSHNPSFLSEWDYNKNTIQPDQITLYSKRKIWWKHNSTDKYGNNTEHVWQASVSERMQGNGCPICAGKIVKKGINDLKTTHPSLVSEWDYSKNTISPDTISFGYDKKVWWIHQIVKNGVEFSHSWEASPNSRTNRRSSCPYCSNKKVLQGYNDLASLLPEIAAKWDFEKNFPLKPSEFTIASSKKVYWIDRDKPISIEDRTKYIRKRKNSTTDRNS